jgi:CBS domain-containing protein
MQLLRVSDAMQPLPDALAADAPLNEVIARLADGPADGLPVIDDDGEYRGTVTSQQVEEAMRENALDATAGELAQDIPALAADQTLEEALGSLLRARSGLSVLAAAERRPIGWLTHLDVLRAYNGRLEQGIGPGAERRVSPSSMARQPRDTAMLRRLRGYRIVDLELATSESPVGRRLSELAWPEQTTVLAIRRSEASFAPDENDRLEQGDRLTVLVPASAAESLADLLTNGH